MLIDELLEEQGLATAVTRFAQKHEGAAGPLQSRFYRDLLPLSAPRPGEQYAFEVDLDQCSGCKSCVAACHSLNGLEPGESWRSVGVLMSDDAAVPFQQTVTTACHHCIDPACLNGCPVLAYEKDSVTGIVRHLDDQCIGCQYCVLKCPYEVPRYSSRLGIVRKCDMCSNRLSVGEAPACVQSCPTAAIKITVVQKEVVRAEHTRGGNAFLPETPAPAYTLPSTRFTSEAPLPSRLRAGDSENVQPAEPHWPLVFMLVLTQAAIGSTWLETVFQFTTASHPAQRFFSAALLFAGLGVSILHLGRPLQSWRAFMGVRRSWLSREILVFNLLALSVLLHLAVGVLPGFVSHGLRAVLVFCSFTGAAALLSSIMVYVDTPREFWKWGQTGPRFLGTTLLLGTLAGAMFGGAGPNVYLVAGGAAVAKLVLEISIFRNLNGGASVALRRTATLMTGKLAGVTRLRLSTLSLVAISCVWIGMVESEPSRWFAAILFPLALVSEFAERSLFFRAVAQPKMPGGVS